MESPHDDDAIMLSYYCGGDPSEGLQSCPAVHQVSGGRWLWQGELRDDPHTRSQLHKPSPREAGVVVGDDLVDNFVRRYVKEKYGVDLG